MPNLTLFLVLIIDRWRKCSDFLLRGLISRFMLRLPCVVTFFRCFQLDRFLSSGCLGIGDSDWCSSLDLCDLYDCFVFWTAAIQSRVLSSAVCTFGFASLKSDFRFLTNLGETSLRFSLRFSMRKNLIESLNENLKQVLPKILIFDVVIDEVLDF